MKDLATNMIPSQMKAMESTYNLLNISTASAISTWNDNDINYKGFLSSLISNNDLIAKLCLTLCTILYASNYMFTKELQTQLQPSIITFIRFFISSLLFLPSLMKSFILNPSRFNMDVVKGSIQIGFWCATGFISQAYSLSYSSSAKVSFFCGLGVIMPPIFTYVESMYHSYVKKTATRSATLTKTINTTNDSTIDSHVIRSQHKDNNKNNLNLKSLIIQIFHQVKTLLPLPSLLALCGGIILELGGLEKPNWSDLCLLLTPFSFAMCFYSSANLIQKHSNYSTVTTAILLWTTSLMCFIWALLDKSLKLNKKDLVSLGQFIWNDNKIFQNFLYTGNCYCYSYYCH